MLRFDSLLLRALAAELGAALRGARAARGWFDRAHRAFVLECGSRRQPLTLTWSLNPAAASVRIVAGPAHVDGALLQLAVGAPIEAVTAAPDERIVRLQFAVGAAAAGVVRAVVLELVGNRWNALALGQDDVIMAVLVARSHDAPALRPGLAYTPPPARPRLGIDAPVEFPAWQALLSPAAPEQRTRVLLANVAYTSPLNGAWILGDASSADAGDHLLFEAYERYRWLLESPPRPCLLDGSQPYPQPLTDAARPTASLLAAFDFAAQAAPAGELDTGTGGHELAVVRVHERIERLRTRIEKLQAEALGAAADAVRLRHEADVLLAHLHELPRARDSVELTDFDGRQLPLQLDPARSPQRNAQDWYEQARRRERAAERVPGLVKRATAELQRLEQVRARLEAGAATPPELDEWVRRPEPGGTQVKLPYRRYRTSGGLEVRVGRDARSNDSLTREHASPDDIWLHARAAGGAHVVLRWGRRAGNPPRADLLEAAGLAALHSRARTSAVVPVDWTRRKYVRKPRKAAPGEVQMERASTLFVAPDPALERRLRAESDD